MGRKRKKPWVWLCYDCRKVVEGETKGNFIYYPPKCPTCGGMIVPDEYLELEEKENARINARST